jgi:hypothetical protein
MFEADFSRFLVQTSGAAGTGDPSDADQRVPGPDSALSVMIRAEHQRPDTDEELMHKHHEQFDKLTNLLSTDIGDNSAQSLRHMVLEWQDDSSRSLLTVSTGRVKWVLQKHFAEGSEGCSLCHAEGKRPGLVLDHNLEVISRTEAGVIADYLVLSIQQSHYEPSSEVATQLEKIRDNPNTRKTAPPSIRDDVSVSVRNDKPYLAHNIAKIRRKDAEWKLTQVNSSPTATDGKKNGSGRPPLTRRKTQNGNSIDDQYTPIPHRDRESSDATIKPIKPLTPPPGDLSKFIEQKTITKEKTTIQAVSKPPVSVLFLSSTHMRKSLPFSKLKPHGYPLRVFITLTVISRSRSHGRSLPALPRRPQLSPGNPSLRYRLRRSQQNNPRA